jgi:hypothetical protein
MGSKPGRVCLSWRRDLGPLLKCIAVAIHRQPDHGSTAKSAKIFVDLVPWIFPYFEETQGKQPSEHAIAQRIDKGTRIGYEREWPERKYPRLYCEAQRLLERALERGTLIQRCEIEAIVRATKHDGEQSADHDEGQDPTTLPSTTDEEDKDADRPAEGDTHQEDQQDQIN